MLKLLKVYLIKSLKYIILVVLMQSITYLISIYMPYLNGKFVDLLTLNMSREQLLQYSIKISVIGLTGIIISYFYYLFCIKVKNKISFQVNLNVIKHLQTIPISSFEMYDPAYLNQRVIRDSTIVTTFFFDEFIPIVLNSVKIILLIIIFYNINNYIFIVITIFIPIYILIYSLLKKPLFNKGLEFRNNQSTFFNELNEEFVLNREIKTHVDFGVSEKKLSQGYEFFFRCLFTYNKIAYFFTSLDGAISIIFQSIMLIMGGVQVINRTVTLGEFTTINVYFAVLLGTIKYYFNIAKNYQDVQVSVKRLRELMKIPKEYNGNKILSSVNTITINHLNQKNICNSKELSFRFIKSNIYGIVGHNGSGKTTLFNIIYGVVQVQDSGDIYYNDINIHELDLYNLREKKLSIMIQNEKVPSLSVKEYISIYCNIRTTSNLIDVLYKKGLSRIFLTNSFNITNYAEKKLLQLSGGERQMIILLRTLLKEADVYILDEPSSNIDSNLTFKILEYIEDFKKDKIYIIATHNDKIIQKCDEVIMLD